MLRSILKAIFVNKCKIFCCSEFLFVMCYSNISYYAISLKYFNGRSVESTPFRCDKMIIFTHCNCCELWTNRHFIQCYAYNDNLHCIVLTNPLISYTVQQKFTCSTFTISLKSYVCIVDYVICVVVTLRNCVEWCFFGDTPTGFLVVSHSFLSNS